MKAQVLVVDDDAALRRALVDRFRHWGHAPEEASDGRTALATLERRQFDLVLLDLNLPDISGLEVLGKLRQGGCGAEVVVLTAHGSVESAVEALKAGATDFLQKPADFDLLRSAIERSLERRRLANLTRVLADQLSVNAPFLAPAGGPMRAMLDLAARAAQSNSTILLTGESGTGKQVLAEFIHASSPRREGPFVYVNCVALSDELVESTLFGHEKGAFTGAINRKEGRLESAAGGTAFLDEVGDITSRCQTKLLHFLEKGEFERVGGSRTLSVDCRLVAATNRDLPGAIREGHFREDLFYRLNVIALHVPPLRERTEEIPHLARFFLDRCAAELKRGPLEMAPRTLEILKGYSWPGNVRQLKNAVERMAVLAGTGKLGPELLPPEVLGGDAAAPEPTDLPLKHALRQFEKGYIGRVLAATGGNQTRAAEILGLQRTYLNRLIKQLGV
jgi:two-component system, NtrC family, response regulator AtoC